MLAWGDLIHVAALQSSVADGSTADVEPSS